VLYDQQPALSWQLSTCTFTGDRMAPSMQHSHLGGECGCGGLVESELVAIVALAALLVILIDDELLVGCVRHRVLLGP